MSNNKSDSSAPMAIFLASLVLLAINARADEKVPQNKNMRLIWTSDCPKGSRISNTNMCKKKIYADDSINLRELKWQEVEDIAKMSFKDWKQKLKERFNNKQQLQ